MGQNSIRKKILLRGVTSSPDDYLCPDGDLACAMGVENTDGGMRESGKHGPEVVLDMKGRDFRVVFEHKVKPENNWIVWTGSSNRVLLWLKDGADFGGNITPENSLKCGSKSLPKVEAIGNTLIIVCENDEGEFETHYVLWKPESTAYNYLGTHIPELEMRFGLTLKGRIAKENGENFKVEDLEAFNVSDPSVHIAVRYGEKNDGNAVKITPALRATINKTFSEANKNGLFVQPFLVRYALRLYNGSHYMISAPVFMQVCDLDDFGGSPYCIIDSWDQNNVEYYLGYIEAKLVYLVKQTNVSLFAKWKDIVKGVDVYVTPPFYTYTEKDEITMTIGKNANNETYYNRIQSHYCIGSDQVYAGRGGRKTQSTTNIIDAFKKRNVSELLGVSSDVKYVFNIGYKSKDDYYDEIRNSGEFYLLKSYSFDELVKDKLTWIDIDKSALNNINTAKALERDSYHDHDQLMPEYIYAYNGRLNLGGVKMELYHGFNPAIMLPYQTVDEENKHKFVLSMSISQDNQFSIVNSASVELPTDQTFGFLYYPNTAANSVTVIDKTINKAKVFSMEEHKTLNGSVFFDGYAWSSSDFEENIQSTPEESNLVIDLTSKLHTSDINNPWIYQPTNINTIGNGRVLGMAAVTTALSQGQHGAFPMYVFTTEGIYSLSVNSTGGWVTSQTVTRDVMREGTQLLQIDNAIVFVSDQGLMLLQGDKTVLVSEEQCEEQTVKIKKLPGLNVLLKDTTVITDVAKVLGSSPTDNELDGMLTGSLNDYLRGGRVDLYYDYTNQRVIVGREDKKYAWVLALKKNTWTTQPWQLLNSVKSYPDCYAMYKALTGTYYLVKLNTNLSNADKEDAVTLGLPEGMLIVTRPIKLGEAADMLKELENLTVEGLFDKTKMGVAVWGTRNYRDWHLVGSCRGFHIVRKHGSGYRAFVVALMGRLRRGEWLDSITMQVQPRYVQKMHGMGYAGDAST